MRRTRVLIVDTNLIFRQALAQGLSQEPDMEVVGTTGDRDEALSLVRLMVPHVVILDADAGDSGLEMAVTVRRLFPGVDIIALASSLHDEELYMAIRAGLAALLPKSVSLEAVVSDIRSVIRGERPITEWLRSRPRVASRLVEQFQAASLTEYLEAESLSSPLSPKELQILGYIAQGNSNRSIASKLGIKEQSVKNYVTGILRKIEASDRAHAVSIALRHGWIQPE